MTFSRRLQIFQFDLLLAFRSVVRKSGFDLVHYNPYESLWRWLAVDLVIDVGANIGQFRDRMRWSGWKGPVISFEPNPDLMAVLESRRDPLWRKCPTALSDKAGEVSFFISPNDNASSLNTTIGEQAVSRTITVQTTRLDQLGDLLGQSQRIFLKIDAEGHDMNVLRGAQNVLNRIAAVQVEAVTIQRFDGEILFNEVISEIERMGFALWRIQNMESDKAIGRDVGFDLIFVNKALVKPS
jgi:FkbM family methyltransferase